MQKKLGFLWIFCLGTALAAQVPPGWNAQLPLGREQAVGTPWYGFGTWSADHHGPPAALTDSLGFGNALTGNGLHLEAGVGTAHWDLAAQLVAVRDPAGHKRLDFYRGHATWRSRPQGGWELSLEREPMVWGYGLNGGYLLGEAACPFPRLRLETPMVNLHLGGVSLGTWGFQAFLGRLSGQEISPFSQYAEYQKALAGTQGNPQSPYLDGFRVQARFGESLEFYANYLNLWGGSLNGRSLTEGYSTKEYITAMFGIKDALAEANVDPNSPTPVVGAYRNGAISASNADVGLRLRLGVLERRLSAQSVYVYLSRGSKNVWWNPAVFVYNPGRSIWDDTSTEAKRFVQGRFAAIWNNTGRYVGPNLASPNDSLGLLVAWANLRLGIEYLDTVNIQAQGVRSFNHYIYLSGFYYQGDPLGNATAGEARTTTLRGEAELTPRLKATTLVHLGSRPFRDTLAFWQQAHPGLIPDINRFFGLQQTLNWKLGPQATLNLGVAWQHQTAVQNVPGAEANAFRYYTDLTFRWPSPRP